MTGNLTPSPPFCSGWKKPRWDPQKCLIWDLDLGKGRAFSVTSAHEALAEPGAHFRLAKLIWKSKMPSKVSFLLWLMKMEKLITVDHLKS